MAAVHTRAIGGRSTSFNTILRRFHSFLTLIPPNQGEMSPCNRENAILAAANSQPVGAKTAGSGLFGT